MHEVPVYVFLHEVVRDPRHPSWEAALSRLAERGDGSTLRWLADLDSGSLPCPRRLQLESAREAVRALAAQQLTGDGWGTGPGRDGAALLERAAFAELEGSPVADALVDWTIDFLRAAPAPDPAPVLPGDDGYLASPDLAARFASGELEFRSSELRERLAR